MKFLYYDGRTVALLRRRTSQTPLVQAGFFFWNSGTTMQMSRMGLLQTLLYQSLENHLDLVPRVFPQRWTRHELFDGARSDWTWSELKKALKLLVSDSSLRFCFFIDGLDEFGGGFAELAQLVIETAAYPNVKICIASRPELVFEELFQHVPRLRLEDLTRADTVLHVSEKLGSNSLFAQLKRIRPIEALELITEITDKASGVFLWVYLVVASLLTGLRDGDSIEDLQRRLLALPSDLEALFRRILDNVERPYFAQACKMFQLHNAARKPLTLLGFCLAETGYESALAAQVQPFSSEELNYMDESMRRRFCSRCKGLLEAQETELGVNATVHYLHRTVRDFFKRPEIWSQILSGTELLNDGTFDAARTLCGSFLHQVKRSAPPKLTSESISQVWGAINECIFFSRSSPSTSALVLLDELDLAGHEILIASFKRSQVVPPDQTLSEALTQLYNNKGNSEQRPELPQLPPKPHWTVTQVLSEHELIFAGTQYTNSFFEFALVVRLYEYICLKLKNDISVSYKYAGHNLLYWSVLWGDIKLMNLLFDCGADPNASSYGKTDWQCLSQNLYVAVSGDINFYLEAVKLFTANGADPQVEVWGIPAVALIKRVFDHWRPEETEKVMTEWARALPVSLRQEVIGPLKPPVTLDLFPQRRLPDLPKSPGVSDNCSRRARNSVGSCS